MTSLIFLTVVSMSWNVATSMDCTPANLGQCTALVSVHGQKAAVVPWYSKAVVSDICSRYQQFVQCLEDVLSSCTVSTKLLYQGVRDAYDFICNDGFDDYLQYQSCFANTGVQSETGKCNETLSNNLHDLNKYNASYQRARLCQYSDTYIGCVGDVIKSFCSVAAETWQQKFDKKTLCPVLVSQNCLGWATQCRAIGSSYSTESTESQQVNAPSWFIIVLSLSIALASLVIVAAVVILACLRFCPACRRRRSSQRQQQQESRRSSLPIEMPPPYPGPFIPGPSLADLPSAPTVDDIAAADEACGGFDVVEKQWPIDDEDEGYFVPDAVEMNAKLAEAIPPPPHYEQRLNRHHYDRRQRPQGHQQPQLRHGQDNDCFVPDDAVSRYRGVSPASSSAGWRRQTSAETGGSDSGTWASLDMSADSSSASGSGGGFTGSSSSRKLSPPSFYAASTASSSLSSQSPLVLTDDQDTTPPSVDYY